jgi:2,4-dienoyl-CoA reductase (NADPH2)
MTAPFPTLLSPIRIGAHTLRNRVVMGSMHTRLETLDDPVTRQVAFYRARAEGGVALIVTGGYAPNQAGLMEPGAPILTTDADADPLRPVLDAVHAAGAKMLLQVLHAGRYAKHPDLVAPSAIRAPINRHVPRAMTEADILQTIEDFARCASLAVAAGFDGVEVMGSEGYLINQFAATRTNQRTDQWGGTLDNRLRFADAVLRRVRTAIGPGAMLVFRLSALDLVEGGATGEETDAMARLAEAAGADALNTGIGWHEATVPTIAYTVPRGAWSFTAARLRPLVGIPIIASNRISTPAVAEAILADGEADLVSLARPMLADPDFVWKAATGRADEINVCIACNQACLDHIFTDRAATCLVNPRAGRETEFDDTPAAVPRRVAVVGAGAAGLACAITAAARGHQVSLFEAATAIGGQMNLARQIPGKQEFDELLRYFSVRIARTGVQLRLGTHATTAMLQGFDVVVLATGVIPRVPDVPGIEHRRVVSYADILSGRARAGQTVAILGAGGIGFDVAEMLSGAADDTEGEGAFRREWGVDATITTAGGLLAPLTGTPRHTVVMLQRRSGRPGARLGVSTGWILRRRLQRRGVRIIEGARYDGIDDAGLHYSVDGVPALLATDTIVLCTGQDPVDALQTELSGVELHVIGGARLAAELDAQRAIDEGTRLGCRL